MDKTDDIVKLIDDFMSGGGGHMNITVKSGGSAKTVDIHHTADCPEGSTACSSPTLFEGLDRDEE